MGGTAVLWQWTEDPDAPCTYCVQWRPAHPDADPYEEGAHLPYLADGRVAPLLREGGPCERCAEGIALYHEWGDH